jgi:hypothetical protein
VKQQAIKYGFQKNTILGLLLDVKKVKNSQKLNNLNRLSLNGINYPSSELCYKRILCSIGWKWVSDCIIQNLGPEMVVFIKLKGFVDESFQSDKKRAFLEMNKTKQNG